MTDDELIDIDLTQLSDDDIIRLSNEYETKADQQYFQLGLDYNLKDTHLIQRLEDQTGLLSLVFTVAYKGGVNYNEAFGTVGIWDTTIYRALMSKNIVPKVKGSPPSERIGLQGGFVKDPQVGMHKWVVSFDLNSLYPNLMNQYNMSPETYVGKDVGVLREYIKRKLIEAKNST